MLKFALKALLAKFIQNIAFRIQPFCENISTFASLLFRIIKNSKSKRMLKIYTLMCCFIPVILSGQIKGYMEGVVRDTQGKAIAGANIYLNPDNYFVKSNDDGTFKINVLYNGKYTITVSCTGYQRYEQVVNITAIQVPPLTINLKETQELLNEVTVNDRLDKPDDLIQVARTAMPVKVITRQEIELMGSRRLDEVLKEQTGIAIVNNIAEGNRSVGVQMQGFSSAYVMILIDGQPMVGRNGGSFDLSRISVTNIERIEIIKGAASCLFGSEAMGGAINVITRHGVLQPQGAASIRYGSLNIVDATLEGELPFASKRGEANLSANYYRTDGFNVNTRYQTSGTTVPPSDNYTLQGRSRYRISKNSTMGISGRYALRKSLMSRGYLVDAYTDDMKETDINASTYLNSTYQNGVQALTRFYFTHYGWDDQIRWETSRREEQNNFRQSIYRGEQQFAYKPQNDLSFTGGIGGAIETMDDPSFGAIPAMKNVFIYAQGEWQLSSTWQVLGGGRYDYHAQYGGRFNPNIGFSFSPISYFTLKGAVGAGFKTPDFRQRFQVFTNPLVGYTVLGADIARERLVQMQQAGEISELRSYTLNKLQQDGLQAEKSNTFNLTALIQPSARWQVELSAFYHHIKNQIGSFQVATAIDGQMIYSYLNLPQVNNKGLEASISYQPLPNLDISMGYQYLISKDESVQDSIQAGHWPYYDLRNPATGETYISKASDYWGIENRSRYMANLRIFYRYQPWDLGLTFRINYRGKYPFEESNGNYYIDRYDTFVNGFFLLNASIEKKLMNRHLALQLTAENIADYTDYHMPGQLGRVILAGVTYRFFK